MGGSRREGQPRHPVRVFLSVIVMGRCPEGNANDIHSNKI